MRIFVTLGTQDKSFERLLNELTRACEKDDVLIVQSGYTHYSDSRMDIRSYLSPDEMNDEMQKADLIICHGGVGSIIAALKMHKKVIAAPRYAKYAEHQNDHQCEIVDAFAQKGYLLAYYDGDCLKDIIAETVSFEPKAFVGNQSRFNNHLKDYLETVFR